MQDIEQIENGWMHLCVDVTKETCDPAFYQTIEDDGFDSLPEYKSHLPSLDNVAKAIADFTKVARPVLGHISVYSNYQELSEHESLGSYFNEQGQAHRVDRVAEDSVLEKTQMSAVPENKEFFENLMQKGIKGFIVTGLYLDACILETVQDLQSMGFKAIVAEDLVDSALSSRREEGMDKIKNSGAMLETQEKILSHIGVSKGLLA